MMRSCWKALAAIASLMPLPCLAGTPIEAVKPFYEHPGLELKASELVRFVDPARRIIEENNAILATGEEGCLDPGLAFDSPNADPAEIAASLKFAEAIKGDEAKVIVAFTIAHQAGRMEWKLKKVGGDWKVADILSVTGEWALSQFGCE
jgi:hypothetical protein